ncbi:MULTISPECIES: hypothetical protein [Actinomyces]|uniref:Uncharacterized protein n=1 Tax=Actinomyces oris TaxID=544580 RepID=A0A1Q8V5M8_9ACTO|nr:MULTISPECIES: hypothetical protein [Actinomyces]EFW26931.1 hypothetical protein HMPREF9057_01676 [Actinomyces sp. oral taxon 171 str. F0337]OLO43462.1 hypothetical protein BKH29_10180 [Actinomyces oris]QCT33944.1 hypothetical protein FBF36_11175 [Actinomyces sp. oral taxon 171 str. F0337]
MTDQHSNQSQDAQSPGPAESAKTAETEEAAQPAGSSERPESAESSGPGTENAPEASETPDGSAPPPPPRVLTTLRALRALRLGWLLAVGAMTVLFLAYQSGLRDPGHTMKAAGGFVGGLAALIWIAGYFKWRETARFTLKSYPSSPRALVRKTVLFQPLCLLVFSGGFTVVLLRLWYVQLRSTSVSIDQLLTLAVGALGLGLLAATDLLVRATRATYFPPPRKRRFPEQLHRLRRIRLPRPSWRSVLGAVILIVIPPLALGTAATVPHLIASRVTPSTAASIDTSALPALPRSFASTAAWSQDIHNMAEVVAGAAGPVVLSSDGVVGLNPADGSTRWTYPRKHARFIRCYPSPDRRHLAMTLDATDGEEPEGMSIEPLVVVLDTVTGRVTYEGFMQEGVLQLTDSVLLNGATGYSLTDGSRLWSIDAEDVSVSPDTWPYSGTAGHSSFLLRGTQRRPDGRESRDGLYGTYTLMPDTAPSVRRESAPLLTDGRGSPLAVGGWVAAFTETPRPIDFKTSPTGWAAQAVNLDAMAGVAGADTTTYDLGLTSGANTMASHATGTLTTLPQRTVGNGAGSMPTSPQELEGGTTVAAIFDPQTRTVSHSAQEAGVLSYAGLARAESGSGGVLSVSSGERTPTTVDVPAGSTYYPPGTRHVWTIEAPSPSSNPLLTTLSTPGTTLVIMATGPDKGSHSFRIFGISGVSS